MAVSENVKKYFVELSCIVALCPKGQPTKRQGVPSPRTFGPCRTLFKSIVKNCFRFKSIINQGLLGILGNSWEGPRIVATCHESFKKYPMDFWMGGMWPFLDCARRTLLPSTPKVPALTLVFEFSCCSKFHILLKPQQTQCLATTSWRRPGASKY